MGQLHYSSDFVNNYNQTYTLEIRSKTDTSGTDIDFDLTSDGFKIKWDKGKNLRLSELMPSTLTFGFIIQSNTERDFVKNVLSTSRGNWYIRIYKNGSSDVYWGGWIEGTDSGGSTFFNVQNTESVSAIVEANGSSDYFEIFWEIKRGSSSVCDVINEKFGGYKIIE